MHITCWELHGCPGICTAQRTVASPCLLLAQVGVCLERNLLQLCLMYTSTMQLCVQVVYIVMPKIQSDPIMCYEKEGFFPQKPLIATHAHGLYLALKLDLEKVLGRKETAVGHKKVDLVFWAFFTHPQLCITKDLTVLNMLVKTFLITPELMQSYPCK